MSHFTLAAHDDTKRKRLDHFTQLEKGGGRGEVRNTEIQHMRPCALSKYVAELFGGWASVSLHLTVQTSCRTHDMFYITAICTFSSSSNKLMKPPFFMSRFISGVFVFCEGLIRYCIRMICHGIPISGEEEKGERKRERSGGYSTGTEKCKGRWGDIKRGRAGEWRRFVRRRERRGEGAEGQSEIRGSESD